MTNTDTLTSGFKAMQEDANQRLVGRGEEIHTAIVALLARQHHLQVGPPGTAKSLLADTITGQIGDAEQYSLLFSRQTKVEEVYGPISLKSLADDDEVRFNTKGFLPGAHIFFGDEIFKSSAALLNTMLWLLNERKFRNAGEIIKVPLIAGFFGSNEFPEDDRLDALYDRIAFRHWIDDIAHGEGFKQMMNAHMNRTPVEPIVALADLQSAHKVVDSIVIEERIIDALWEVDMALRTEGVVVSSRTMANATRILRASAFLRGADEVNLSDIAILRHVLWSDKDDRKKVANIVLDHAAPLIKEANELREAVDALQSDIAKSMTDPNHSSRKAKAVPHKAKLKKFLKELQTLTEKMKKEDVHYPAMPELKAQLHTCSTGVRALFEKND